MGKIGSSLTPVLYTGKVYEIITTTEFTTLAAKRLAFAHVSMDKDCSPALE